LFVKAVPAIIDRLEDKIKIVVQKVELLRQENKLLHDENVKLNKELKLREKLIRELEDQRNLFSEQADSPKVSHKKVEHTLDQYIRQIDQCVEMVKNIG
jgi:regulator of replication initiation timing